MRSSIEQLLDSDGLKCSASRLGGFLAYAHSHAMPLAIDQERIFERFLSTRREGMAMGLAIARSIITSHGGEPGCSEHRGWRCTRISRSRSLERLAAKLVGLA